ncbi:unnamed protein product, partial [Laminaria digitata]
GTATGTTSGGEGSVTGRPASKEALEVKVNGGMVGDILELGAQCVRAQSHLQEVMQHHISAQLKLQAEIHEHLTTAFADIAETPAA